MNIQARLSNLISFLNVFHVGGYISTSELKVLIQSSELVKSFPEPDQNRWILLVESIMSLKLNLVEITIKHKL